MATEALTVALTAQIKQAPTAAQEELELRLSDSAARRRSSLLAPGTLKKMDQAFRIIKELINRRGEETTEVFAAKKITGGPVAAGVPHNNGGFTQQLRQGLPVLGLSMTSVAATGLATGAATPATGLGLLAMLIVGLSTVTVRVLRA